MKKLLLVSFMLISAVSFANKKENNTEKQNTILKTKVEFVKIAAEVQIYCDGVYKGTVNCDCSADKIANIAIEMCK